MLAFVALIPLAIIVAVRTAIAVPAIVLERISGWGGLQRSWALVERALLADIRAASCCSRSSRGSSRGSSRRSSSVPASSLDPGNAFVYDQLASAVAAVFIGPITYVGVTLLYYDARIRKEGFDIEMLARSL